MRTILDLPRIHKQLIAVAIDSIMLPLSFCLAIWLRYDEISVALFTQYKWLILTSAVVAVPIFIRFGLYRAVIRFIDQKIIFAVVRGMTFSVVVLVAIAAVATHMTGLSRGVFGIYWITATTYLVASRFIARGYFLHRSKAVGARPVAIYGAGRAGMQLAMALRTGHEYLPVAFVDDKRELQGAIVAGIRVHPPSDLPKLVGQDVISEILLAMPSLKRAQQKQILERLEPLKVRIKITPRVESLVSGELRVQDIRDIEIEDLLGRDPVAPDRHLMSSCITGKSVLVTGAGGSIGSELCRQILQQRPARLLMLEVSEYALYSIEQELRGLSQFTGITTELIPFLGSVLEGGKCERILRIFSVDTIYHAAAYKHVPLVEHNPIEGIRNNVFGTLEIAKAAMAAGVASFVLVSTDKAVRPTNVMGATKRMAELVLQAFAQQSQHTRFCMVRFGNVLGSSGSVVPLFRKQILAGGPITLTHPEITRYFMTIPEAAQLVLQAGAMGEGGDVFVLDMGEPVRILDLAKRMVHLCGLEVKSEATPDGTIEIVHVGLRPGEKLYEELLIGENVEGTAHPLILRAKEKQIPWDSLKELLDELAIACHGFNYEEVRSLLLRTVTEYTPQCGIEDFLWCAQNQRVIGGQILKFDANGAAKVSVNQH